MERLIGNIWYHDDGTGEISFYERIGRNQRPLRPESEELPDRLPFEAKQAIKLKMRDMAVMLNARTPKQVRIANLKKALALFPRFQNMDSESQTQFLERMSVDIPEEWEAPKQEPQGLPRLPTIEETVEAANKAKLHEIDVMAQKDTEIMRLKAKLAESQSLDLAAEAKATAEAEAKLKAYAEAETARLQEEALAAKDAEIARLQAELTKAPDTQRPQESHGPQET